MAASCLVLTPAWPPQLHFRCKCSLCFTNFSGLRTRQPPRIGGAFARSCLFRFSWGTGSSASRFSSQYSVGVGRNEQRKRHKVHCALQQDRADDEKGRGKKVAPTLRPVGYLVQAITALAALVVTVEAFLGIEAVQKALPGAKKKKKLKTMTAEEREVWTKGLPLVEEHIPYKDILSLKKEDKIKHIIRHPESKLKEYVYEVFVVMSDDRVVRTVLPTPISDEAFWKTWDELKLDEAVTEAYTPPPPPFEIPAWATKGPSLSFLKSIERSIKRSGKPAGSASEGKRQKPKQNAYGMFQSASAARLQEIERAKLEKQRALLLKKQQEARLEAIRKQRENVDEVMKKNQAARIRRAQQRESRESWNVFWATAAINEGVRFTLGVFFFWLFYVTVVVGIKKRRQDYEDRIKIRKAEDEERRNMKKMEREFEKAARSGAKDDELEENDQLKLGLRFMRSGAKMRQGRAVSKHRDDEADVKFSDVAGLGDIKIELEEIVDFFTHAEKFRRRGCKIPSGILLCGDPGVGKTLLAKAVAGEAGVNFFAISASQFVEIYVGVGASRVRSLYTEAKENAPAVVFIDELDAVGRLRGLSEGSGGQERDATLNQLLTCLDGFEGKGQVITIAATNRPDVLDPALVRPGRFDRKIFIPKPSLQGRTEILQVHARSKPMAENVDFYAVAQMTEGMVGAQLAHVVDIAALAVLRDGRTEVTTDDLLEGAQNEEGGQPDLHIRSERVTRILALQEASMAAMAANCPDMKDIQMISIVPRMGEEKGFVRFKADVLKMGHLESLSRQGFLDHITVQLAPRAADELWNGADQLCTVWSDNVDIARKAARSFVLAGHSDKKELYGLYDCCYDGKRIWDIDVEAQKVLKNCYERALEYLKRNRDFVNVLVERLIAKRTIWQGEFEELVQQFAVLDKPWPQPLEVQKMNREAFEQQMMAKRNLEHLKRGPSQVPEHVS